jgi:NADPH-dependent 2,4-dienoyl-CoA reductase/sulfur reductase-like enzyme
VAADPRADRTTCAIADGGPAGMMLGLLLARAGIEVTLMEKHADFLRDFRGDTVHASTLRLLDEPGLAHQFDRLPHRLIETVGLPTAILQALQRAIHDNVVAVAVDTGDNGDTLDTPPPRAVRLVARPPVPRRLGADLVAIGPLPENAPGYARRGIE